MLRDRLSHLLASRYLLGEELAGGGMARVFAAHEPVLDRSVVIKVLPPERASAIAVERFRREARLLARLSHPHVVPVIESGESGGLCWFVMPRVSGDPLDAVLQRGPLDEATVRRLGIELLDALQHAHALGVVHRDIKPANILLHAGHALLADFGVALLRDTSDDLLTAEGQAVGTVAYMAPEQHRGEGDALSDCWSLAATLYEAASGSRWDASGPDDRWHGVPPTLVPTLRRALAREPGERWPDAAAFQAALASSRTARFRTARVLTLLGAALAISAVGWMTVGGRRAGASGAGTVDIAIVPHDPEVAGLAEAARRAGLLLQWLPDLTVDRTHGQRLARLRVELEQLGAADDSTLELNGLAPDGELLFSRRVARGPGEGRDIARAIVAERFPDRLVDFDLLGRSGGSVQGWREFWDGLEAFQQGRFAAADTALAWAFDHDTTFVAAAWVRSLARMWQREDITPALAGLVDANALPPPIDMLVAAQRDPDIRRRIAAFDAVVAANPHYSPARLLLANELFHRGPLVGVPLRTGIEAFRLAQIETPDLDHVNSAEQVLWGAIRLGDEATARAAIGRLRAHPDRLRHEVLLLAFDSRFQPAAATVRSAALRVAARGPMLDDLGRYLRFGLLFDLPALQRQFANAVRTATDDPALVATAAAARATALLMEGRPDAAFTALSDAVSTSPDPEGYRADLVEWQLVLPLFGVPVANDLARTAPEDAIALSAGRRRARMEWVLSVSGGGRADRVLAMRWRDALGTSVTGDAVAGHLERFATARITAARGEHRIALEQSSAIDLDPGDSLALARGSLVRALVKFDRGRWQLALGDTLAALAEWRWVENNDLQGWPVGSLQEGELDAALSPLVRLHRAVLLCATGDRVAGRAMLRRVDELWRAAEPAMRRLSVYLEARERCR